MEIENIGDIGETYFAVCDCSGDEENMVITETGLKCCACGVEQPYYTDQDEDDWSTVEYELFGDC
jgi:hypothetical protein